MTRAAAAGGRDTGYDVVVVGARIAGSTVAALLGDAGARVLLVERVRFPSSTLSTHFFRGAGLVSVLDRLRVLDEVLALEPPRLRREWAYGFHGLDGPQEGPPQDPGEAGFGLSVRRDNLDDVLLRRARRSVDVAQPASVVDLVEEDGRVAGVRVREGSHVRVVRSRVVVGADGRRSRVAAQVRAVDERRVEPLRTIYYRYVSGWRGPSGEPPDAAEFSLNGDEMAYVFPSDRGATCIAVSAPAAAFVGFRSDPSGELDRRLAGHPFLARRLARTEAASAVAGGAPEPSWMRVPAGPGWVLVGDSGVHRDPWTGEGMDCAGLHAVLAAEAILDVLAGRRSEVDAWSRYRAARNEQATASFEECTTLARDLSQLGRASA